MKRIVSSSTAAEALAANDALDTLVCTKSVLLEMLGEKAKQIPMRLITDSKNLYKATYSSTPVENKRLRIDIGKLKESIKTNELHSFIHVEGKDMLADVLTKKGASAKKLISLLRCGKSSIA